MRNGLHFLILSPGGLMGEGQFASMVELGAGLCPEVPALLDLPVQDLGGCSHVLSFLGLTEDKSGKEGQSPDSSLVLCV